MLKGNFNKVTKQFLAVFTDRLTLHEKCSYLEFFWSVISCIQTKYGEIQSIFPHLIRMWENTDQKNSQFGHFSRSVTFSEIIPQNRALTGDTMVISQAEMRKDE